MDNNNEGLAVSSRQSEQGLNQAPDTMDRAVRFLVHQLRAERGCVEVTEGDAIRFALSERVPERDQEETK